MLKSNIVNLQEKLYCKDELEIINSKFVTVQELVIDELSAEVGPVMW